MVHDTCPLTSDSDDTDDRIIARLLRSRKIAIVGLSDNPSRPSFQIGKYLIEQGKQIEPVNPNHDVVLGLKCHSSLADVPGEIDLVSVFRRPEYCADVVRDAIARKTGGIWLQTGIRNAEAARLAKEAAVDYVEDRCIMVEHLRRGSA